MQQLSLWTAAAADVAPDVGSLTALVHLCQQVFTRWPRTRQWLWHQRATPRGHPYAQLRRGGGGALWPTPDARDAQAEGLACGQRRWERYHTAGLQTATFLWATPIARDYRGGVNHKRDQHPRGTVAPPPLNSQVSADGSLLNPVWVECLMGYPPGWTDCAAPPAPP